MKKNSGFTLLELLITIAIVGVLAGVGIPSLQRGLQGNQLINGSNGLYSALRLAYSEAKKEDVRVSICESSDGVKCSATGDWSNGWIVFHNPGETLTSTGAACTAAGGNCLIRIHSGFTDQRIAVSGVLDITAANINIITFTSRGLPKTNLDISESGVFSVCSYVDDELIAARAVVLNVVGRARISDNQTINNCPTSR